MNLQVPEAALSSLHLLSDIGRMLSAAPDLKGALQQVAKLLDAPSLRKCEGIILWNCQSKRKLVAIGHGTCCKWSNKEETALVRKCWLEEERFAPRIHRKTAHDIVILNGTSLASVEDWNEVDALCLPIKVGGEMALSIAIKPLCFDQISLQGDLLVLGAVSVLLKQWIELRFHPQEISASEQRQMTFSYFLAAAKGSSLTIEEMLVHRIGEMVTVLSEGSSADKSLYNRVIELVEKGMLRWALSRANMVQIDAAQLLGINRNTLRSKLKSYGLYSSK